MAFPPRETRLFRLPEFKLLYATLSNATAPISSVQTVANAGGGSLFKGGALTALIPNGVKRYFEIVFNDAKHFQLSYRNEGEQNYHDAQPGDIDHDFVSVSALAFILKDWWIGNHAAGDTFRFMADPRASIVEMPLLFFGPDNDGKLGEINPDPVNSLIDGTTVVAPATSGPIVNGQDLFKQYESAAFEQAGYVDTVFVDDAIYHNKDGEIHCGTNVIRQIGITDWWSVV